MSEAFDPYVQWLGIRDPERPPNHYALLGVRLFEDHPEVLAAAADRQMAYVRTFQTGPHSIDSQQLLNELAAARLCVLDPVKKAAYDAQLLASRRPSAPSTGVSIAVESPTARPKLSQAPLATVLAAIVLLGLVPLGVWAVLVSTRGKPPVVPPPPPPPAVEPEIGQEEPPAPPEPEVRQEEPPTPEIRQETLPAPEPDVPSPAPEENPDWEPFPPGPTHTPRDEPAPLPVPQPGPRPEPPAPAPPSRPDGPAPVPEPVVRAEARREVERQYAQRRSRAVSVQQIVALAQQMLDKGRQTADDPPTRWALCVTAGGLAAEAGETSVLREAAQTIARHFEIDWLDAAVAVFDETADWPRAAAGNRAAAQTAMNLAAAAVRQESFDAVEKLLDHAGELARKARDLALAREAGLLRRTVPERRSLFEAFRRAEDILRHEPDNPAANLTAGRYECFIRGDWAGGCRHLAKGSDARLKKLAELEQQTTRTPQSWLAVGDAWWEAARSAPAGFRGDYYLRAGYWYEHVVYELPGPLQAQVQKRLIEIRRQYPRGR